MKKLMVYEIKNTWRYVVAIVASMLVLIATQAWVKYLAEDAHNEAILKIAEFLLAYLVPGIIVVVFMVLMARFYKSMFLDEGYLSFTLPVKPLLLIVSKMIVALLYILVSTIISFGVTYFTNREAFNITMDFLKIGFQDSVPIMIFYGINMLLTIVVNIVNVYFSFSVGQVYHNKMLVSIIVLFVINIVQGILTTIAFSISGLLHVEEVTGGLPITQKLIQGGFNPLFLKSMIIGFIITGIIVVLEIFLIKQLCQYHLNLE